MKAATVCVPTGALLRTRKSTDSGAAAALVCIAKFVAECCSSVSGVQIWCVCVNQVAQQLHSHSAVHTQGCPFLARLCCGHSITTRFGCAATCRDAGATQKQRVLRARALPASASSPARTSASLCAACQVSTHCRTLPSSVAVCMTNVAAPALAECSMFAMALCYSVRSTCTSGTSSAALSLHSTGANRLQHVDLCRLQCHGPATRCIYPRAHLGCARHERWRAFVSSGGRGHVARRRCVYGRRCICGRRCRWLWWRRWRRRQLWERVNSARC